MSPVLNLKEIIVEALTALGGSGSVSEVKHYLKLKYGREWKHIETVMADLSEGSQSSFFLPEDRVLRRIGPGKYALKTQGGSESQEAKVDRLSKAASDLLVERKFFSFRDAEAVLKRKGQLSTVLDAASLTDLSSKEDHKRVQHFLYKNRWDIEVSLFPVITYKLDAFKEKTGIEIERSLIDAIHRSLFRCLWAYAKKQLDVLVFIVPTYKEPKFEQVKRDIQEFGEIIPYPVYVIGATQAQP
jgi:hypothetical protein